MKHEAVQKFRIHMVVRFCFYDFIELFENLNFKVEETLVLMSQHFSKSLSYFFPNLTFLGADFW